ncbi:4'-phosphopantetheinyl transferase superfamily protein [Streptomyces sp. NPDC006458]|uniref:4'-phosphopantetheinyl transferase family protein n=1 Tax=Streptomyces sp. NPDC006458 TaxID=3154302 RepID=UPI0033BF2FAA
MTDLWLLPEQAAGAFAERMGGERLLCEEEHARMARMLMPRRRRQFLAGRLLCRHALSMRTGHPPDGWQFPVNEYGRPEPSPDGYGVRFNLSHTDGLICCVVTDGASCGVDVESPLSQESATHVARFFSPSERSELAALPQAERAERTTELWVLKEAYIKGLGIGGRRDFDGFAFAPRTAATITVHDPQQPHGSGPGWWFELLRTASGHSLAIAVEGGRADTVHLVDLTDPTSLDEHFAVSGV